MSLEKLDKTIWGEVQRQLKVARQYKRMGKTAEAERIVAGINVWLKEYKYQVVEDRLYLYSIKSEKEIYEQRTKHTPK